MLRVKVIFIDRDGVRNKDPFGWTEHSYVTRWEDFYFLPGAKVALKRLFENGYDIIIVSNQGGVSKNIGVIKAFENITTKYAIKNGYDGVMVGHVHQPKISIVNGIKYFNSGDLINSISLLTEDNSGEFKIHYLAN